MYHLRGGVSDQSILAIVEKLCKKHKIWRKQIGNLVLKELDIPLSFLSPIFGESESDMKMMHIEREQEINRDGHITKIESDKVKNLSKIVSTEALQHDTTHSGMKRARLHDE